MAAGVRGVHIRVYIRCVQTVATFGLPPITTGDRYVGVRSGRDREEEGAETAFRSTTIPYLASRLGKTTPDATPDATIVEWGPAVDSMNMAHRGI